MSPMTLIQLLRNRLAGRKLGDSRHTLKLLIAYRDRCITCQDGLPSVWSSANDWLWNSVIGYEIIKFHIPNEHAHKGYEKLAAKTTWFNAILLTRSSSGLVTSSGLLTSDRFIRVIAQMKPNKHRARPRRRGVMHTALAYLMATSKPPTSYIAPSTTQQILI